MGCAFGRGELAMCSKYQVARWEYLWHSVVVCGKKYWFGWAINCLGNGT